MKTYSFIYKFVSFVSFVLFLFLFLTISRPIHTYAMTNTSILDVVNEYRVSNNLEPLTYDNNMQSAADIRADESIKLWSHTRPDGSDYYTVNVELVYGENLAYGYSSESELMTAWINSDSHRKNLLEPRFKTACVGIAGDHVALEFGR